QLWHVASVSDRDKRHSGRLHRRKGLLMTHAFLALSTVASLLLLGATGGSAQTVLTGIDSVDDRIDDIDRAARLDLDRGNDAFRYGSPEYREGLSGSASLGYSGKTGATDS